MKLYLLKRLDDVGYDEFDSMIVRAKTAAKARKIAAENSGDEGNVWLNCQRVTCEALTGSKGKERLILGSFNAG